MAIFRRRLHIVTLLVVGGWLAGCSSADVTANPSAPPGANPTVWVGAFCGGLGDVIAGQSQAAAAQPTPQLRKDGLIKLADNAQQALASATHKLTQLGAPAVTDGTKAQESAVSFFTTVAAAVGDRRAKLAALDANNPNFAQQVDQLTRPDIVTSTAQVQGLTANQQLMAAFSAAPECQRLAASHQ